MELEPSGLLGRSGSLPTPLGPQLGATWSGPSAWDLSSVAATVLLDAPRSLLGRYRHTWDAKDSKLGGDVNGPGQTNPGIRAGVPSRGAGAGLEGPEGWDRNKKKKKKKRWRGTAQHTGEGGGDRDDAPSPQSPHPPPGLWAAVRLTARACA